MKKRLIFDTANCLFRVAAANGKYNNGTPEEKAGLAMHVSLQVLNKHYLKYKPDELAVTFEGANNWRKAYTKSENCKSKRVYKANRVKDPSMEPFFELMKSFENLVRNHSSLVCLSNPNLEGDDLFAGYVQRFAEQGDEVYGVSGDKDFLQLLKYKNFYLINPDDGHPRAVDDADFFMYEKCFRGDSGDNVMSALPRVRKARLIKSRTDDFEYTSLMNEQWTVKDPETGEETTYKTKELYEENKILMDLSYQPEHIRQIITETLDHELANHGKFSFFEFQKFCGKFGLTKIADNSTRIVEMLSTTGQFKKESIKKSAIIEY